MKVTRRASTSSLTLNVKTDSLCGTGRPVVRTMSPCTGRLTIGSSLLLSGSSRLSRSRALLSSACATAFSSISLNVMPLAIASAPFPLSCAMICAFRGLVAILSRSCASFSPTDRWGSLLSFFFLPSGAPSSSCRTAMIFGQSFSSAGGRLIVAPCTRPASLPPAIAATLSSNPGPNRLRMSGLCSTSSTERSSWSAGAGRRQTSLS
jgi:hypothetical protein